jgi:hypothetical protein
VFARVRFGSFFFDRLASISQRSRYASDHAVLAARDVPYAVLDF